MGQTTSVTEWERVIRAIDAPVAVTREDADGRKLITASASFTELSLTAGTECEQLLASLDASRFLQEPRAFPHQEDWLLKARDMRGGVLLWQSRRRTSESTVEKIASWVASASVGDIGMFFFDPEDRLRAYNAGVRNYFPRREGFPAIGESFRGQLEAILDKYDLEAFGVDSEAWMEDLMTGYHDPGNPRLGITPSGRWATATTTVMGDGSRIQILNDVTAFRERDQQLKLFMRNAQGILFSRRELKPGGSLTVWGDIHAVAESEAARELSLDEPGVWYHFIDERDRQDYIDFMESRKPGDGPYVTEFRYIEPGSNNVRWIRENGWTVTDRVGRHYLDAIYFDVTVTKDAHQALSESEERFRQFADLASDWYFETDARLYLTFLSERYEQTSGAGNARLMNRPYSEIVALRTRGLLPELAAPWHELLRKWQHRESFRDHRMRFVNQTGRLTTVSISGEPRFDDKGAFIGYRGIGRDMTALTEAEHNAVEALHRAEKANDAKSAFIANVSHELRTPLNAIIGFSSIMSDEVMGPVGNDRYRQYAEDIRTSGNHLLSLVNDLLDMSKMEAGRISVDAEDIRIGAEVSHVLQLLTAQAQDRTIETDLPDDLPLLSADPRGLRQILINLVSNAFKYTRSGGSVRVSAGVGADDGIWVRIADDGMGIAADEIGQIFEPFGRAKSTIATEGTGLGLPLSRNLMRLHGGELEVDSAPGRGTIARMSFPPARTVRPADGQQRVTG